MVHLKNSFLIIVCCVCVLVSHTEGALRLDDVSEGTLIVSESSPESSSFVIEETSVLPVITPPASESSFAVEFITETAPELFSVLSLDKPLRNYPNPFSFSSSSTTVGYSLSKDADVSLHIYSLMGYKLYTKDFSSGLEGGSEGYNRVTIDKNTLSPAVLSPGVYLYILESNGELLGKNKMAVTP